MESSSSSVHGFAGRWTVDHLGIILFRCSDRFCRIRYGQSTIEQSRERSNCFDFSNVEGPLSGIRWLEANESLTSYLSRCRTITKSTLSRRKGVATSAVAEADTRQA